VIALDSSILVGIIRAESDAQQLLPLLDRDECAIGAPTLVEARLWCSVNLTTHASDWLEHFIDGGPATIVPFSREMADVASEAFIKFGRPSGHPARLNWRLHGLCRFGGHARAPPVQGRGFRIDGCNGASGLDPGLTATPGTLPRSAN